MIEQGQEIEINGLMHKIGAHGLVYIKPFGTWIRSTKTPEELKHTIRQQRRGSQAHRIKRG